MRNQFRSQAAANEVIMRRLGMMWMQPFATATHKEAVKMVTEKHEATAEAAMAFSMSMVNETWKFWSAAAFGRVGHNPVQRAVNASLRKAALPLHKRVRANRKRLAP